MRQRLRNYCPKLIYVGAIIFTGYGATLKLAGTELILLRIRWAG